MMTVATPEQIHDSLWSHIEADGGSLYAILDGARDRRVYPNVLLSGMRNECLYEGSIPDALAQAAPYLLELKPNTAFSSWLFKYGWGDGWGIFFTSPADFDTLRQHFRRFLLVKGPEDKRLYFRFYDPRVWRLYLPTCTPDELDFVFGPVAQYLVEGRTPETILSFTMHESRLIRKTLSLTLTA